MSASRSRVLPGFGLSLGFTLAYMTLLVLIPLSTIVLRTATISPSDFWNTISSPRALAAFRLSFFTALAAALLNGVFGVLVAWVLVRDRFPGRDFWMGWWIFPFALPPRWRESR
jgi:sulfate transport system permease protein